MGLLTDIRNKLIADSVVEGSTGWKCYVSYLPDDQDKVVGVFATGGLPSDTLGGENELPTFQVRVRGSRQAYTEVETKWYQVFDSLQDARETGVSPDPLEGYYLIHALATAPMPFQDEKMRVNMTVNFRVVRKRPS